MTLKIKKAKDSVEFRFLPLGHTFRWQSQIFIKTGNSKAFSLSKAVQTPINNLKQGVIPCDTAVVVTPISPKVFFTKNPKEVM